MSTQMLNNLKHKGLGVFLDILRLHRQKLPFEMRSFGDVYVKQEFKQFHHEANAKQYEMFLQQWEQYARDLRGMKDGKQIGKQISAEEKDFLNEEQLKTLDLLQVETKKAMNSK